MHPELLTGFALFFFFSGARGLSQWHEDKEGRPLIFPKLGISGELLIAAMTLIVLIGSLSLIIWALIYAAWWAIPVAVVVAWVLLQLMMLSFWVDAFITSAFGPAFASGGILVLNLLTWPLNL